MKSSMDLTAKNTIRQSAGRNVGLANAGNRLHPGMDISNTIGAGRKITQAKHVEAILLETVREPHGSLLPSYSFG